MWKLCEQVSSLGQSINLDQANNLQPNSVWEILGIIYHLLYSDLTKVPFLRDRSLWGNIPCKLLDMSRGAPAGFGTAALQDMAKPSCPALPGSFSRRGSLGTRGGRQKYTLPFCPARECKERGEQTPRERSVKLPQQSLPDLPEPLLMQ